MSKTDTGVWLPPDWWEKYGQPYPPAVGEAMTCPVFGESFTRLTDAIGMGRDGLAVEYSHSPVGNIDNTLVRLTETNTGEQMVFDVATGAHVRSLRGSSSPSDYWWDINDPDIIYMVNVNPPAVFRQHISSGFIFEHMQLPYTNVVGTGESGLSLDGDLLSLTSPIDEITFVVSLSQKRVVSEMPWSAAGPFFDATLTECGKYYKLAKSPGGHVWNVNATASGPPGVATYHTHFTDMDGGGHNDTAVAPDGRCYMFGAESNHTNQIIRRDFEAGTTKILYPDVPGWIPTGGGPDAHFSANSCHLDGWVYWSVHIGAGHNHDPADHWEPYRLEVCRFRWDGIDGGPIERLFHHRSQITPTNGYWGKPGVCIQSDGSRGFFSSTFMRQETIPGTPARYTDAYTFIPPGGPVTMADIDTYKAFLNRESIPFTEEAEMQPAVPTGNTLITMTDDDGDEIVSKFDGTGMQIDLDANPT